MRRPDWPGAALDGGAGGGSQSIGVEEGGGGGGSQIIGVVVGDVVEVGVTVAVAVSVGVLDGGGGGGSQSIGVVAGGGGGSQIGGPNRQLALVPPKTMIIVKIAF